MFDPDDELPAPYRDRTDDQLGAEARFLAAQRARLEAEEAELVQEVQRRRSVSPSPFRDTAAWLRLHTGIGAATARLRAVAYRELALLPGAQAALAASEISFDHVRVLAHHADGPNRDQVHDDEAYLVGLARKLTAEEFRHALADWAADLDAQRDAGACDQQRQRARRRVSRGRSPDGLRRTILDLDDESDEVIYRALRDIVAEMNRADRRAGPAAGPARTAKQRWADAAVELARRSRAADQMTKHRARPTILAMVDASLLWDQLRVRGYCELEDGTQLTARQLRRLACEADIVPMVMDSNGVCLDMGETVRLATYPQRLALRALHPTCAVEGCDTDFDWCEIHHLHPWQRGGPTDLDNLVPLCSYHHHLTHDHDLHVELQADRTVQLCGLPIVPVPRRRRRHLARRGLRPPDLVPAR